jgi:hypothetical protein
MPDQIDHFATEFVADHVPTDVPNAMGAHLAAGVRALVRDAVEAAQRERDEARHQRDRATELMGHAHATAVQCAAETSRIERERDEAKAALVRERDALLADRGLQPEAATTPAEDEARVDALMAKARPIPAPAADPGEWVPCDGCGKIKAHGNPEPGWVFDRGDACWYCTTCSPEPAKSGTVTDNTSADAAPTPGEAGSEATYPCAHPGCTKRRTKAQGGAAFAFCAVHHPAGSAAGPSQRDVALAELAVGCLIEIAAAIGRDITLTPAQIVDAVREEVRLLRQVAENQRALAEEYRRDAARLRADFPPAPPLPEHGCKCSACRRLRELQDGRHHKHHEGWTFGAGKVVR